jgi:hypothetical protein
MGTLRKNNNKYAFFGERMIFNEMALFQDEAMFLG